MLSKNEKIVMKYIYNKCHDKGTCLLSSMEISNGVSHQTYISSYEIDEILKNLEMETLISVVNSDKNGRAVFVITLKPKGQSFERDQENKRKALYSRIVRTVIFACLSFVITFILKQIFF